MDILAGYFSVFYGYLARQVSVLYGYCGTNFRCCQDVVAQNLSVLNEHFGRILLGVVRIFSTRSFVALRIF
jgi:hypothetical protein